MKDDNVTELRICPICGRPYSGVPALSRTDNKTKICPDCGTRQALESIGVDKEGLLFEIDGRCRIWRCGS